MNNDVWQLLENYYKKFPFIKCANSTDEQVKQAEYELGLIFNDFYKNFLKNYECSSVRELYINTLTKSKDSPSELWSVIEVTKWFKDHQKWPNIDDWYIVSDNNSGDPIGIKPNGEVWISYHDSGFEQEKLANDFEEFLYKLLTNSLWE